MTVLLLLAFFGFLAIVGIVAAGVILSRPRLSARLKWGLVASVWFSLWLIPFWDLVPGKLYMRHISQDAGLHILSSNYSAARLKEHAFKTEETPLPFHVTRVDDVYSDPVTKEPLVRYRSYTQWVGNEAFYKPWMAARVPSEDGAGHGARTSCIKSLYEGAEKC